MAIRANIAGGLLALFVSLFIWWKVEHGRICERDAGTNQENCTAYKFASFVGIEIGDSLDAHAGAIQALMAVVVAGFTWTLLRVSKRQALSMRRQTTIMRQQNQIMNSTLVEAKVAADAAKASVDTMKDTSERQLRAYVGISHAEFTGFVRNGTPSFKLISKNNGQTPAYGWYSFGGAVIAPVIFPGPFVSERPDNLSFHVLGPGDSSDSVVVADRPISEAEYVAICDGLSAIWVFGEGGYTDAFGKERRIKYRFMISGFTRNSGGSSGLLAAAADGNESD